MYAELHSRSNFTFLEGASHPEELVEIAAQLGIAAIALTDRDGLYGAVRFSKAASKAKIPGIIGAELGFEDGRVLTALVENADGYANLCELVSTGQLRGSKTEPRLRLEDLDGRTQCLVVLCNEADLQYVRGLRERLEGRLYVELQH